MQMSHLMAPALCVRCAVRLFFLCTCYRRDALLGGPPELRLGIYIEDKPGVQRLQMMISLINK